MALTTRHCEVLIALASTTYNTAGQTITSPGYAFPTTYSGMPAGGIEVGGYSELTLDFNISAISGTSASVTVTVDRYGADGVWYNIYSSGAKTATGSTSTTIGVAAETNKGFGNIARVQIAISNTTTPSATMTLSLVGKS